MTGSRDAVELLKLGAVVLVYLGILRALEALSPSTSLRLVLPNAWLLGASAVLRERTRSVRRHDGVVVALFAAQALVLGGVLVSGFTPGARASVGTGEALALVVAVPVAEEMYFRGSLLAHLRRTLGAAGAVLVVSALFGLLHLPSGQHMSMAVLSVVLSLAVLHAGSMLPAVLLHGGWNALAVGSRLPSGPLRTGVLAGTALVTSCAAAWCWARRGDRAMP